MWINKGTTRIVFVFKTFVIKIPNFLYSHQHFLQGCYANWSERRFTKSFKCLPEYYNKICPTLFCTWFGLISIQPKAKMLPRPLTETEKKIFELYNFEDIKTVNIGYYKDKLVLVDYV